MELTPQGIREVRFREKLRGYDHEDVEEFVDRVASLVEGLAAEAAQLRARLDGAERRAAEAADAEESLRRTLVLAQRTADAAIHEAREEAERLLSEARAEHDALVADTDRVRRELAAEAEGGIREEIERLTALRSGLEADVAALHAHIEEERSRFRSVLVEQLDRLDRGALKPASPPQLPEREPPPASAAVEPAPPATDTGHEQAEANEVDPAAGVLGPPDEGAAALGPEGLAGAHIVDVRTADLPDDDPFLAELRRAVTDDAPLGPRDDDPLAADHEHDLDRLIDDERGRFGSRLRRRR